MKRIYAIVCKDWNGHDVYTSFYNDPNEAVKSAMENMGAVRVEEAHTGKEPIWVIDSQYDSL